jgi:hypothetical protein
MMIPKFKENRTGRAILLWLAPLIIVVLLVLLIVPQWRAAAPVAAPTNWPTQGWQHSTPEAQGIDSVKLDEGLLAMREQDINIHSLLIIRNGNGYRRRVWVRLVAVERRPARV